MPFNTEEIIKLIENFSHIDDPAFEEQVRSEIVRHLNSCFNDHGSFSPSIDAHRGGWNYDDCRDEREREEMRIKRFIFNEDGDVREEVARALPVIIEQRNFGWRSDAVHLHYANEHGRVTRGSYPASWMHK
jgi:hypothetical protein